MDNLEIIATVIVALITIIGAFISITQSHSKKRFKKGHEQFSKNRKYLRENRQLLVDKAFQYYESSNYYKQSEQNKCVLPLLSKHEWLPDQPIPLAEVIINLDENPYSDDEILHKFYQEFSKTMPYTKNGDYYALYSDAIRQIEKPEEKYFSNNKSYRLVKYTLNNGIPELFFTVSAYFNQINIGEALAYEYANNMLIKGNMSLNKYNKQISGLSCRKLLGDPFNLLNRHVLPGINTLTIRQDGSKSSFYMHRRDNQKVATGMGTYSVVPAGEFQPSTKVVGSNKEDFDMWKNIMREYSEEFLGADEHYDGELTDYNAQPFTRFNQALKEGQVRCYYLGLGIDPLSLKGEILTICIWDAEAFDSLFSSMVLESAEGKIQRYNKNEGIRFSNNQINAYLKENTMPVAKACLKLAYKFRNELGLKMD